MKAEKTHQCGVCKKWYHRSGDLGRHNRIHTGERPYVCKWPGCTKAFTQRSGLKAHIPVHTGEKMYHCGIGACSAEFGDASSCGRHRRDGHPPVQITHQCPVSGCKSRIKRRSSFRSHLKKHKLDPKEVDLDSCVVVVKREEPEDPSELLQIPDIIRRSVSRSSSRSNTPLSALSPLSSLSDISEVSTPCEEPHKDFLGMGYSSSITPPPLELSPLPFETLDFPPLQESPSPAQWSEPSRFLEKEASFDFFTKSALSQFEPYSSSPYSALNVSQPDTWCNTSFDFLLEGPVFQEGGLSYSSTPYDTMKSSQWAYGSSLGVQF